MMEVTNNMHDPQMVIQNAEVKFSSKDMAGAQQIYQCALLDWVDDAREMEGGPAKEKLRNDIATLWISFANLNIRAKLFKSATEVFEQAVNCEVAGNIGSVWISFARFQQERNRKKTAQKIYLRALVGDEHRGAAIINEEEKAILWTDFLKMMQDLNNNPDLTLEQLRNAVETEHVAHINKQRQEISNNATSNNMYNGMMQSTNRVSHEDAFAKSNNPAEPKVTQKIEITAKEVEDASSLLLNATKTLPPEISAAWFARDGDSLPTRPEPPLFSPSPPKLVDASGKDLLGTEMALKLTKKLLKKSDDDNSGSILLEICRACWLMTALKENEASKGLAALEEKLLSDKEKHDADLEARLSVAGPARAAVALMNDKERNEFLAICNEKKRDLTNLIAWEFRKLLALQQQILTNAGVPGFDGVTVDGAAISLQSNICRFMQSSFYLRTRIGETQHVAMLKSQEEKLVASKSIPPPPPPPLKMMTPLPPPHFHPSIPFHQPPIFPPPPPPPQNFPQQFPPPNMYTSHQMPPAPLPIHTQPPPIIGAPNQGQIGQPNPNNSFLPGQGQQQNRYHT